MNPSFKIKHALKIGATIYGLSLLLVNLGLWANYFMNYGSYVVSFLSYITFIGYLVLTTILPALICTSVIFLIGRMISRNDRKVQAMLLNGLLAVFLTSISLKFLFGYTFSDLSFPGFFIFTAIYMLIVLFTSMSFFSGNGKVGERSVP